MKEKLNKILISAIKNGASDVHFKVGAPPLFRIHGSLFPTKAEVLTPEDTRAFANILTSGRVEIDKINEFDCSYTLENIGRFRVNIFRRMGNISIVLRYIPFKIPTFEELNLPSVLAKIAMFERGLVLVTGTTGSGKSTTLASMIDYINSRKRVHIITIEDPIEFLHKDKKASISQREVGIDTKDFSTALRAALREDPDVILVGEMRDAETIDIALKAAETGHLVLSTVHTTDAIRTISRLISVFPSDEQEFVRIRLAESLKATISQRLLPRKDGKGRVVAVEIMIVTPIIEDCIKDKEKTHLIKDYIEKGRTQYGMQTFDQHLLDLFNQGIISFEVAKAAATSPSDFERAVLLSSDGIVPE